MTDRFDVDPNEPAVQSAELRRIVQSVRSETPPTTNVGLSTIRRQIAAKGRGFRTGVAAGVLLAAAASVALWFTAGASEVAEMTVADSTPPPVVTNAYAPFAEPQVKLSDAVRVTWRGGEPPSTVHPWELRLGEGDYTVNVGQGAEQPLMLSFASRQLELTEGEVDIQVQGGVPVVTLKTGVAAWVDRDGTRTTLVIRTQVASRDERSPKRLSANELAREAELQLADGERRAAILSLRTLVQRHPRSTAARSALLDLGRELKKEGMRDHASCAYQLYLERWPQAQLRAEVRRDLDRLGQGSCDGLDPR